MAAAALCSELGCTVLRVGAAQAPAGPRCWPWAGPTSAGNTGRGNAAGGREAGSPRPAVAAALGEALRGRQRGRDPEPAPVVAAAGNNVGPSAGVAVIGEL